MKIAIIGGGWVGCHMSYVLKSKHEISLYEKNEELFKETSYNNQNRLHLGFHYARNYDTRNLCISTFDRFMKLYGHLTSDVKKNIYCVPKNKSIIDYETYLEIFKNHKFEDYKIELNNIKGCISTDERYINFHLVNKFFNNELSDIKIRKNITQQELEKLSKNCDLVINATNNHLHPFRDNDMFYELTLSLIYKKISETKFDALTLVDGEFFSIYPYDRDTYTVTDVKNTPLKRFDTIEELSEYKRKITKEFVLNKKYDFEKTISHYYLDFHKDFEYVDYFLSTKCKINNESDTRYPVISVHNNIINCFTGKIQGVFIIEDFINNYLS